LTVLWDREWGTMGKRGKEKKKGKERSLSPSEEESYFVMQKDHKQIGQQHILSSIQ